MSKGKSKKKKTTTKKQDFSLIDLIYKVNFQKRIKHLPGMEKKKTTFGKKVISSQKEHSLAGLMYEASLKRNLDDLPVIDLLKIKNPICS